MGTSDVEGLAYPALKCSDAKRQSPKQNPCNNSLESSIPSISQRSSEIREPMILSVQPASVNGERLACQV